MLDTPDIYKKIAKLAQEQFQQDLVNNLIPNNSQFDLPHAEKINKRNYMAVIERLVSNCPINGDYEKHKKELQEYTQKYIAENYPPLLPETTFNILNNYKQNEILNMINPPLQAFVLYVELIRQLYFYIQEKYIRKIKQLPENNQILLAHVFVEYSLELLNGICSLLLGGNYNSVISVYRTFYENYIIFEYLQKHSELTDAFIDHARIDDCILRMEFAEMNGTEISKELKNIYDTLIKKYGEDFDDDYGWASSVISDKSKRKLKTMFEESALGKSFNFFYKLSCKYSHSTSFSLQIRSNFDQLIGFIIEIIDITEREIKVVLRKLTLKSKKEEALLYDWLGVTTDNLRRELKKWYGNNKEF